MTQLRFVKPINSGKMIFRKAVQKVFFIGTMWVFTNGFSQNGAIAEFKFSSSKGIGGNMKASFCEYGHKMEINMVNDKIPGGMMMTTIGNKKNPDVNYALNEKTKTYSEIKKQDPKKISTDDNRNYTVKKLGEETINGFRCIHFTATSDKDILEIWNTKDIQDYSKYREAEKLDAQTYSYTRQKAIEEAGCDGFPVKTIGKSISDKQGGVTMELVKFEKKYFLESDFSIPVGYTKSEYISPGMVPQINAEELMKMTPEQRAKYIEEMKAKYGK